MEHFNTALGQTLLHSLWQGAILAALTGLVIVFTRKTKAANRYLLMVAALLLFTLGTVITFCTEFYSLPSPQATTIIRNVNDVDAAPTTHNLPQQVIHYVNHHSPTIVMIWFLIVLARSLQLATGLQGLYMLRRRNLFAIDEAWAKRVALLSSQLGINRVVGIAESGLAKVPMVIGHLKPLILIPVGLLTRPAPLPKLKRS